MTIPASLAIMIVCAIPPAMIMAQQTADISQGADVVTDADSVQASPCRKHDRFREFDFWLGVWDVHMADGTYAGKNRIESAQSGCVLIENWMGASGVPGMSMNYYDVVNEEWVQVWVGAGGTQIVIRGGLTDDGMALEGHIHYVGNRTAAPFRGLWTPLPDGRVRQFFEQSNDDGTTWAPWFEGFYTRIGTDGPASED